MSLRARLEEIEAIVQQLHTQPSEFVRQFQVRLASITQHQLKPSHEEVTPLSELQKALIHAFQLYDYSTALKLIANYDPAQIEEHSGYWGVRKSLFSLQSSYKLVDLTRNRFEDDNLNDYMKHLEWALAEILNCPPKHLSDPGKVVRLLNDFSQHESFSPQATQRFFYQRQEALFSKGYFTYLILRNRFILQQIRGLLQHEPVYATTEAYLLDCLGAMDLPVKDQLAKLDFREAEYLAKRLSVEHHEEWAKQVKEGPDLGGVLEEDPEAEELGVRLVRSENSGESQDSGDLAQALSSMPALNFDRTDFEIMCFRYAKELIYMDRTLNVVRECSAPHFRSQPEEYNERNALFFETYFNDQPQLVGDFQRFLDALLQATHKDNPFAESHEKVPIYHMAEGQWQISGKKGRLRESALLLAARLPRSLKLKFPYDVGIIERSRPLIFQFGLAHFDYDQPGQRRAKSPLKPYLKVLIRGARLTPTSAIVYVGSYPYYTLTDFQLIQWKGLILLFLITCRNRYSLEFSPAFESFLTEVIPESLESN